MPLYEGIGIINEKHPVVLEIGKAFTKVGFAGETSPRCVIPSIVRCKESPFNEKHLFSYSGENDLYHLLVDFLHHIYFKYLLVTPKDRRVVIVESLFMTTEFRHVLAKVLYLHFEVLTILWIPEPLAAVCATGSDTALVLDIGHEEATIIPVYNGVTILKSVLSKELGAKTYDENLRLLALEYCKNVPQEELETLLTPAVVEDMRVRAGFFASPSIEGTTSTPDSATKSTETKPSERTFRYELDGDHFLEFDEVMRDKAAEIWFCNDDIEGCSLPLMLLETLMQCPIDSRLHLASSILVTGGTALLPGFKSKLLVELRSVADSTKDERWQNKLNDKYDFKIYDPPVKPNCLSWLGGAIYGASEAMTLRGVSKEFFMKSGFVPDWCNQACNLVSGLSNVTPGKSSPFAMSTVSKSL